jgi:D-xylose transport system permease protein
LGRRGDRLRDRDLVARLGIPSFVVTLAFFLALQGAMLLIIGEGGTIPIRDGRDPLGDEQQHAGGARLAVRPDRRRPASPGAACGPSARGGKAGLPAEAMSVWGAKVAALGALVFIAVFLLNQERQRETATITIQGVRGWSAGRGAGLRPRLPARAHAVRPPRVRGRGQRRGGAARRHQRRAGQDDLLRARARRWRSWPASCWPRATTPVSPTTGGAQTLLYAVGAAVIGGTSLFGGRGRIYDAVTGGLVVAVIANGPPARHAAVGNPVHHQRHRAPRGGERRCHLAPASGGNRQMKRRIEGRAAAARPPLLR